MAQIPIPVKCNFVLNGNDIVMSDLVKKLKDAVSKEDYTLAHELKCKIDNLKKIGA